MRYTRTLINVNDMGTPPLRRITTPLTSREGLKCKSYSVVIELELILLYQIKINE